MERTWLWIENITPLVSSCSYNVVPASSLSPAWRLLPLYAGSRLVWSIHPALFQSHAALWPVLRQTPHWSAATLGYTAPCHWAREDTSEKAPGSLSFTSSSPWCSGTCSGGFRKRAKPESSNWTPFSCCLLFSNQVYANDSLCPQGESCHPSGHQSLPSNLDTLQYSHKQIITIDTNQVRLSPQSKT